MNQKNYNYIISETDEYGFERPDHFNYETYSEFLSSYIKILAVRSRKWEKLLSEKKILHRNNKLKRYIRKGIPAEHRGIVWLLISGAADIKNSVPDDFYENLLKENHDPSVVEVIKLDLPRTFPNNIFFKNVEYFQTKLFNVLTAYAHHNPKIGYCQGLNYIAGLLLLVTKNEETTFWLLKTLIEKILEDYYSSTMNGLITDIEVLSELIKIKVPEVYNHFSNLQFSWPVICTKWFVCLFVEVLPVETVLRIWDCLFYEGSKIFFRVGITLIKLDKEKILACKDYVEIADWFNTLIKNKSVMNCHLFMESIFTQPGSLSNSVILKLRQSISAKHQTMKQKKTH